MRAGLGRAADGATVNVHELRRLVMLFMEHATRTALTYTHHAGRTIGTTRDVWMGMQHESHVFFQRPTIETDTPLLDAVLESESESESETESETGVVDGSGGESQETADDGGDGDDEEPEWTRSTCACELCAAVHHHVDTWDAWEPEDEVQRFLKRHTTAIMNRAQPGGSE